MTPRLKGRSYAETRSAVVDLVRTGGRVSRAELSERSGLTEVTISKIVRELLDARMIREAGFADSRGGKRPAMLEFNARSFYAAGISFDATHIVYVLCDINGRSVEQLVTDGYGGERPETVLQRLIEDFEGFLARSAIDPARILGVGVAGSGRLDANGAVLHTLRENIGWNEFPIEVPLAEATGLPVRRENDANCAALGEFWSGRVPATRDFATVFMDVGIGCGLLVGGDIYRGASSNAGEIGHVTLDFDGPQCWCGSRGCLELFAAPPAVVAAARTDAGLAADLGLTTIPDAPSAFTRIARSAVAGEPRALALIERSARYLATAVLGVVNMFDLDTLFLAGPAFADAGPIYLETLRSEVSSRAFMRAVHPLEVSMSQVGVEAAALGAASSVLHANLTPHFVAERG